MWTQEANAIEDALRSTILKLSRRLARAQKTEETQEVRVDFGGLTVEQRDRESRREVAFKILRTIKVRRIQWALSGESNEFGRRRGWTKEGDGSRTGAAIVRREW